MKKIVWMLSVLALSLGLSGMALAEEGAKKGKGKDAFAKLDTNGDGKLSEEEFTAGKSDKGLENAKKKFAKLDADSDGSVTKEEMKAAKPAKGQAKKEGAGGEKKKKKEKA
jgi:Ca2+-binding EF-hand superfamily protein